MHPLGRALPAAGGGPPHAPLKPAPAAPWPAPPAGASLHLQPRRPRGRLPAAAGPAGPPVPHDGPRPGAPAVRACGQHPGAGGAGPGDPQVRHPGLHAALPPAGSHAVPGARGGWEGGVGCQRAAAAGRGAGQVGRLPKFGVVGAGGVVQEESPASAWVCRACLPTTPAAWGCWHAAPSTTRLPRLPTPDCSDGCRARPSCGWLWSQPDRATCLRWWRGCACCTTRTRWCRWRYRRPGSTCCARQVCVGVGGWVGGGGVGWGGSACMRAHMHAACTACARVCRAMAVKTSPAPCPSHAPSPFPPPSHPSATHPHTHTLTHPHTHAHAHHAGEVHLETCIKDLRERFARVELVVSPPLVAFRWGGGLAGAALRCAVLCCAASCAAI